MELDFGKTEDLRVLLNLLAVDVVIAANFLKNLRPERAKDLMEYANNPELDQLYRFLVR